MKKFIRIQTAFLVAVFAGGNNNVGTNYEKLPICVVDDIHFDLAPTAGTATLGTKTGQLYTQADLAAIILARGATYRSDGSAYAVTDELLEVEVDLKPCDADGWNEGDSTQPAVATTSDASYQNNGSWTNLDGGGGRDDGQDESNEIITSFDELFVENGSITTVHVTFRRCDPVGGAVK